MSDVLTPKEQLTAYQRWELPAFDFAKPDGSQAGVALPTAAQVEQTHMQAHEEGYQSGYAEGKQKADMEVQRLVQVMNMLNQELQQIDQKIAQDLLELSLRLLDKPESFTGQCLRQADMQQAIIDIRRA